MKTLAIETSGPTFSIALAEDNFIIFELYLKAGLVHSEKLIPSIDWMLKEVNWKLDDLGKIASSIGPGSFTGIRVGLSCARMLAQSLNIPLIGINSLDILSENALCGNYMVYPAVDALRGEAFIRNKKNRKIEIKSVKDIIKDLNKVKSNVILIGSMVESYYKELKSSLRKNIILGHQTINFPRAGVLALSAEKEKGVKYNLVKPLYVRRSWAEQNKT